MLIAHDGLKIGKGRQGQEQCVFCGSRRTYYRENMKDYRHPMNRRLWQAILSCALVWTSVSSMAQVTDFDATFGPVDEQRLLETKWRYTYTLHLESNTVVHRADEQYDWYLYFRYDNTFWEYLNGKLRQGRWFVEQRTLHYAFRNIPEFKIAQITSRLLVLEFQQPTSRGTYQYHFVRVGSEAAPFERPANQLPEVLVEEERPRSPGQSRWWAYAAKKQRRKWLAGLLGRKQPDKIDYEPYIAIELIGGGYYGGIDPVLKDYIVIKNDGRLIKEFQSVHNGLVVTRKYIPREELEAFARYILDQGFFDMERLYDCTSHICEQRKKQAPRPVPLRLAVTYGDRRKVVTIAIWGKDDAGIQYVDYPPALDAIIEAIQRMASRIEDEPVVRR